MNVVNRIFSHRHSFDESYSLFFFFFLKQWHDSVRTGIIGMQMVYTNVKFNLLQFKNNWKICESQKVTIKMCAVFFYLHSVSIRVRYIQYVFGDQNQKDS